MSESEFDEDAYFAEMEADEKAEREAWLNGASRDDLVAEIRKLEAQLAQKQEEQQAALRPALRLIDGMANYNLERLSAPLSVVRDMVSEIEQHRRRRAMDGRVENFLADYRPEIIAQIVAQRRSYMHGVDYKWPKDEKDAYLANPLTRSFVGVRSGYFNFKQTRYWAAVIDAMQDGDFSAPSRADQLHLDLCEKEENEGYRAGRAYLHECPYESWTMQACMWWHGQRRGRNDYLFGDKS